jgi:2-polyprenyl-3-methyl-5-hydroxy-6-metoxy-1,4-benzoquinol methylase
MVDLQMRYWNGQADRYQRLTQISIDDFHYGPQIPGESELRLLPPFRLGATALELGCGGAQNSIWLARQGLVCTAVDLSAAQLQHARALARAARVKIRFLRLSLEQVSARLQESFAFIHSSHALEFVDDPARLIIQMAERLLPGGTLMISTVHPLYNGEWVDGFDAEGRPDGMGLFLRHYFAPPDDIRLRGGRVEAVSRAYPISDWFNWLRAADLEVVRLEEPAAVPPGTTPPYTSRAWGRHEGELDAIPGTLILLARKRE